jgi:hypothetical protein
MDPTEYKVAARETRPTASSPRINQNTPFRNHSGFHEETTIAIGSRLAEVLEPVYLRVGGYWYPRGGMPIDVFWAGNCKRASGFRSKASLHFGDGDEFDAHLAEGSVQKS